MKVDNPEEAIDEFLGVPALEDEKGDWGFKALKQAIKLEFKLGRYNDVGAIGDEMDIGKGMLMAGTGCQTLHRAVDLCQISCHAELLREVHQQHA